MLISDWSSDVCSSDLLVVPKEHPWAGFTEVDSKRLAEANLLLLRDGHCLREHALAACRLADRSQIDAFGATSLSTLVQMVENGLGVTKSEEPRVGQECVRKLRYRWSLYLLQKK